MLKIFILILSLISISLAIPSLPTWPQQYSVHVEFSVPYFKTVCPIDAVVDVIGNRQFLSYYDGMDTFTYDFNDGFIYSVFPRIDTPTCQVQSNVSGSIVPVLPDLSKPWTFNGYGSNGNNYIWKLVVKSFSFTNKYFLEVRRDGSPVRLEMFGYNILLGGSHPDHYIAFYSHFLRSIPDTSVFSVPPLCNPGYPSDNLAYRSGALHKFMFDQVQPIDPYYEDKFLDFVKTHKKVYSSPSELIRRKGIFENTLKMIQNHNARSDSTYTLGITKFADMELEEIQRQVIPSKFARKAGFKPKNSNAAYMHKRGNATLPSYVNWVEKGAVNPPKDQGTCGSCWTFGTAGSLEGSWAIFSGKLLSLSEQQLLDCSWFPSGNSGCDGGFAGEAFDWISSNKGIALEDDYPYLMVDGYCKASIVDSGVHVLYHVNVTATEEALQDAVAFNGPVAVAIDASTPDFYYLTGGIYNSSDCIGGVDYLDHEVLVVGYGTDIINGRSVDYWLLKNSWGILWGENGFWKMARNSNIEGGMCGIHQQGRYAVVGSSNKK